MLFVLLMTAAWFFLKDNPFLSAGDPMQKCLDAGKTWNVNDATCDNADVNPEDRVVRGDGEDFEGLAIFPTWSAGEPATFPILIDGEARGFWFFEATFPIEIRLENGTVLAQGYAEAQDEWMTTDVVPFYAVLEKKNDAPDYVGQAALILHKANASGLPEHDAQFTTQIFIDTTK